MGQLNNPIFNYETRSQSWRKQKMKMKIFHESAEKKKVKNPKVVKWKKQTKPNKKSKLLSAIIKRVVYKKLKCWMLCNVW